MAWFATRLALALAALAGCALGSEPLASHFDQQLTVFSPQCRLYQVEFAMAAVGRSATTTVALKGADAGGCCDYDSVIGNDKEEPLRRFTTRLSGGRYAPASGEATICGVFVETDDRTGLAKRIEPIRVGGRLKQSIPEL